jgi:RNA recognition motif-containing protein
MSLFIGNVSKKVTSTEFEDAFKGFGNCKIDLRVNLFSRRNATLSCSMIVSDVLRRPRIRCRMSTSAG